MWGRWRKWRAMLCLMSKGSSTVPEPPWWWKDARDEIWGGTGQVVQGFCGYCRRWKSSRVVMYILSWEKIRESQRWKEGGQWKIIQLRDEVTWSQLVAAVRFWYVPKLKPVICWRWWHGGRGGEGKTAERERQPSRAKVVLSLSPPAPRSSCGIAVFWGWEDHRRAGLG